MKILTLQISDSIYDKVKSFLMLFPSDKLKVREQSTIKDVKEKAITYQEFEKKWAGFLSESDVNTNWRENKIMYLTKKHS